MQWLIDWLTNRIPTEKENSTGRWITINGQHILLENENDVVAFGDESIEDAISRKFGEQNRDKVFTRYANPKDPMSDWGHAMFANRKGHISDIDPESGYVFYYDKKDKRIANIEDLMPDIERQFEKVKKRGYWSGDQNDEFQNIIENYSFDEIKEGFNPKNIVDSAGAYDSIANQWLYEEVLEPKGIGAIVTKDGAVVYDRTMIGRVKRK